MKFFSTLAAVAAVVTTQDGGTPAPAPQAAQAQQRLQASHTAAVALGALDAQLAAGNTNIEGTLQSMEGSLGPAARADIASAREALANSDLTTARMFLYQASLEAQAGR